MKSIIFFIFFATAVMANAKAPVWKISSGEGHYFYLAGSVHRLRETDKIPEAFYKAFKDSDFLVVEKLCDNKAKPRLLPDNEQLSDQLRPDMYKKLEEFIDENELRKTVQLDLKTLNPYLAMGMVCKALYQNDGYKEEYGLEDIFKKKANRENKDIRTLEQCSHSAVVLGQRRGYGENYVLNIIKSRCDLEKMPDFLVEWQKGETGILTDLMVQDKKEDPEVYQVTVTERNANWLPQLDEFLAKPKHAFILVGYAHLIVPLSDSGLLESLRNRGYTVEQLD